MRILWFCNTPGLAIRYLNGKSFAGGWIDALQTEIENRSSTQLGFVFYTDAAVDEFEYGKTKYFPVKRILNTKYKRLLGKFISRVEYDENVNSFLKIIERFKPDIIHVHGTENSFGLINRKISEIPMVISIQGNLNVYSRKYFSGVSLSIIRQGVKRLFNKTLLEYKIFKKRASIESEILKDTRYVLGRTDWDRRVTRVLAPRAKYFLVDEMMRSSFHGHQWKFRTNETKIFFTTSSNSLYKGFETIIETALLLKGTYSFKWFIAGLSLNDELVQYGMRLHKIKDLDSTNIVLMGQVSAEGVVEKMLASDVYVQVSHIENSPNSVCEAMLLGLPIIASYAGGTASLIEDKKDGILVQDGDAFALAGALMELMSDDELTKRISSSACARARQRHDPKRIGDQLIDAYNSILKEHNGMNR
jgi:glycosyltransferase involved in cell wall biosynthesis